VTHSVWFLSRLLTVINVGSPVFDHVNDRILKGLITGVAKVRLLCQILDAQHIYFYKKIPKIYISYVIKKNKPNNFAVHNTISK